jgi:PAS domain S-box-containing protein
MGVEETVRPDDVVRILVVDDDPDAADLYRRLLAEKMPVEIVRAGDAATARERLSNSNFDLVTVDYSLPDEAGLPLLEDIVDGEDNPPVIVITDQGDVHLATRSYDLGAAGYVVKDYTLPRTLARTIEKALADAALKRATNMLNRENAFTGLAVNALEEIFFVLDPEGRFTSWNRRLKEITGLTDRELHLMDSARVFTREDTRRLLDDVNSLGSDERSVIRLRVYDREGRRVPYELTAVMLNDTGGAAVGICAIGREVGWSQKVHRGSQVSPEQRAGVAELTGDVIARVDYDGRFTYLSDAACAFWGKPRQELLGHDYTEFIHPEDLDRSLKTGMHALKTGNMIRGFVDRHDTPRGWRYIEWNAVPVFDDSEAYTGFQFTGRDVTDKVQAEQFLIRVNRELDAYAHTVSHDLKGPLSAIMLAADTLRIIAENPDLEMDEDGSLQEMARIIHSHTAHAGTLVENLLVLAESGQVPFEVEEIEIADVVQGVLERMAAEISKKRATVILSNDLGRISGNRVQITQVFSNLIGNAVQHNDNPAPMVEVTYLGVEEGCHRYVVRDNGPGVPEGRIDDIFKLFHKGADGGVGVGLATVDKIVKVYDGFVRVYNDDGACFEFSLKDIHRRDSSL